jgi:pyruvate formate lyase activating enzyme
MEIGGLQKTTLIDYPGHVACTVFLVGCCFRCPWCYSAELVLPDKISNQPRIDKKDFFDFLEKRKNKLEGVVVCGGEPTINQDLPEFLLEIKKMGFKVKLDTNGSNPEMLEKVIKEKLVDYLAMDIKAPLNSEKYSEAVGLKIDIDAIKKSVNLIRNSGVDYEFRTTIVPDIHQKQDILDIAQEISGASKYFLQEFRAEKNIDSSFSQKKAYPREFLEEIKKEIASFFDVCQIRS